MLVSPQSCLNVIIHENWLALNNSFVREDLFVIPVRIENGESQGGGGETSNKMENKDETRRDNSCACFGIVLGSLCCADKVFGCYLEGIVRSWLVLLLRCHGASKLLQKIKFGERSLYRLKKHGRKSWEKYNHNTNKQQCLL